MHILDAINAGSPRPDPLALCTLEAQEATAKSMYRLPHARVRLLFIHVVYPTVGICVLRLYALALDSQERPFNSPTLNAPVLDSLCGFSPSMRHCSQTFISWLGILRISRAIAAAYYKMRIALRNWVTVLCVCLSVCNLLFHYIKMNGDIWMVKNMKKNNGL